jgi:hypothetical protein
MTDLLVLGHNAARSHELASLFQRAGYDVVEVKDLLSCCRQLQADIRQRQYISIPRNASQPPAAQPGVTIFNANAIAEDAGRQPTELLTCILDLARQLTPGWRLSIRHRRLEAPYGATIKLTSLEFSFIKIFTMVEVGEAVSRKQIVQAFGEDYLTYDQNRIDTMVRRFRHKVETHMGIKLPLNTERVRGFSFGDVLIIDP